MDEADIHLAAEQAAAAAAATDQQQQQQHDVREDVAPDAAESHEGSTQQRPDDDVRLFAELASYCSAISSDDHATTSTEPDVDNIIVSPVRFFS